MGPLIGITTAHYEEEISTYSRQYYVDAVCQAGGVPVLLPVLTGQSVIDRYVGLVDGLVLTGGGDVGPSNFGEEPVRGTGKVYPERDQFEISLVGRSLERDIPVLGICRGIQVLNIAMGGDIFQDLYTQVSTALEHRQKAPRDCAWHHVEVCRDSLLGRALGVEQIRVNSFHHQAVKRIAPGFKLCASARDGVIEGIENEGYRFALGVQWHPEAMAGSDPAAAKLFREFVSAASKGRG